MHDAEPARKPATKASPRVDPGRVHIGSRARTPTDHSTTRVQNPRALSFATLVVVAGLSNACTDANLYHVTDVPAQPNKVTFTGRVCTDNPTERSFPLRVVFMVDASPLMPVASNTR